MLLGECKHSSPSYFLDILNADMILDCVASAAVFGSTFELQHLLQFSPYTYWYLRQLKIFSFSVDLSLKMLALTGDGIEKVNKSLAK